MATNNAINLNASGIAKYDGAGTFSAVTVTQHAPLVGAASNGITSIGPLTDGQLVIGSSGADPVAAAITAGAGITVTNGAGTITIGTTGSGFSWNVVSGTSQAIANNNGYFSNNAGQVTFTLPATAAVGDSFSISGMGAGGWTITEGTGQSMILGSAQTTATTGSLTSTNRYDSVTLVCQVANTTWIAVAVVGNITVV